MAENLTTPAEAVSPLRSQSWLHQQGKVTSPVRCAWSLLRAGRAQSILCRFQAVLGDGARRTRGDRPGVRKGCCSSRGALVPRHLGLVEMRRPQLLTTPLMARHLGLPGLPQWALYHTAGCASWPTLTRSIR